MRSTVLVIILGFLSVLNCYAQSYNYVTYTTRDGLAGNMVYDLYQDKQGFLWFGTDNGLSRFDGKNFVNYTVKDGLMDNEVLNFAPDSIGRTWIGTFSHELIYYFNGKFYNRFNDSMLAKVRLTARPVAFYCTKDSAMWIICQNQIFHWPKDADLYEIDLVPVLKRRMQETSKNIDQIWLGDKYGFTFNDSIFLFQGKQIIYYTKKKIRSGYKVLGLLNRKNDSVNIPLDHDVIRMYTPNNIPFLVGTVDGAYEIDTINYKVSNRYLPGKYVTCAIKDKEGNYWFSTLGDGVYKLASKTALTYSISDKLSAINEVFSIGKRNDSILTGHSGGQLAIWQKGKLKEVISFQHYLPEVENSISTNRLKAIVPLPRGGWLLGFDGFLIYKDGKTSKCLPMNATKTIELLNDSIAIVASGQDVSLVDLKSFTVSKVIWFSRGTSAVFWNGHYIIGTLGGVKIPESSKFTSIIENLPVLNRRIVALNKYKTSLWVATSDSGLVELTTRGVGRTFSEQDGLPGNNCRALFIEGDLMWVGTNKGLASINLAEPQSKILIYNQFNLLPNDAISSVYSDNGEVFVGSPSGLTIFEPSKTNSASICGLSIDEIKSSVRNWEVDEKIVLNEKDNFLQIKFAGISAKSAGGIDYYFLLKGLDDAWNQTRDNEITYRSLPIGDFTFQLYAKNKFGVVSEMKSFQIHVLAPFWKTKWFLIIIAIIVLGIFYLIGYSRIRSKHHKAEELNKVQRQLAELEQKALQAQMNPHFIFNSLNSIQQYIVTNNLENANKYLSIFALLIRETLENSTLGSISISKEIKYLEKYLQLEQLRFGNKFSFRIVADTLVEMDFITIPVMLIQPFVENAVRHGMRYRMDEHGWILVEFTIANNVLHCLVKDNGPGREKTSGFQSKQHIEYQSRGMELTKKRIDLLNIMHGENIHFNVNDVMDNAGGVVGTEVHIDIAQIEN